MLVIGGNISPNQNPDILGQELSRRILRFQSTSYDRATI